MMMIRAALIGVALFGATNANALTLRHAVEFLAKDATRDQVSLYLGAAVSTAYAYDSALIAEPGAYRFACITDGLKSMSGDMAQSIGRTALRQAHEVAKGNAELMGADVATAVLFQLSRMFPCEKNP